MGERKENEELPGNDEKKIVPYGTLILFLLWVAVVVLAVMFWPR